MIISTKHFTLVGKTPILGSNPANPKVHAEFVAAKAASLRKAEEETKMLPTPEQLAKMENDIKQQGFTVFLRDGENLVLSGHVIKGFFKASLNTLKGQLNVAAPKSKIDELLFVGESYIPLLRKDGTPITKPDRILERSLRAETMQGPRVSLAASETVDEWMIHFTLTLVDNQGTAKSKPLTWVAIYDCLSYGELKGLGQWRNSGLGSFTWREDAVAAAA